MLKGNVKYILLLATAILLVVMVEWLTPKPVNWTPTFVKEDTNPFGSHILYELLPDIFPGKQIYTLNQTLYERSLNEGSSVGNYLFVCPDFDLGEEDAAVLLQLASEGSHIFIAANSFPDFLKDTLQFSTENIFFTTDSIGLNLTNVALRKTEFYSYKKVDALFGFKPAKKDKKASFQILGVSNLQAPNFIRIRFGEGWFYLNTMPLAYTNYNMLYGKNAEYISKTLSYLPVNDLYWDEYYKPFKTESQTPLRYVLSQPALKWALYISLGGLLLFVFFEAKRKQRIIPIVTPLTNTTLEFTETVGRLYFQYKDHKNIAEKKITYFLDYLRTQFYVKTTDFDEELYTKLSEKTGMAKEEIVSLFRLISQIRSRQNISESELLVLNDKIEDFQKRSK